MKTRYVIKIGSALLTDEKGKLNKRYLSKLVNSLSKGLNSNKEIIIVTSGAVATGVGRLDLSFSPKTIPEKQAIAAVGQVGLMHEYKRLFNKNGRLVAQVLLTRSDIEERKRYLNIRNTILTLLRKNIIPIINENDTVSTEEIKFGDNDTLSALVAAKTDADALIILTDVDGLFTLNPKKYKEACLIKEVKSFDELQGIDLKKRGTSRSTGGMQTKIQAAKIACASGVRVLIANGKEKKSLDNLFETTNIGTNFIPNNKNLSQRQKWMAFGAKVKGTIIVDTGAKDAVIKKGKSLLPAGIINIAGNFSIGDVVVIKDKKGNKIAQGITAYSAVDIEKIKGCKSSDIEKILGYRYYDEVVHRDNMVII